MQTLLDSTGIRLDMRENRGATLLHQFTANFLSDFDGYTITAKIGNDPEYALVPDGNSFTFTIASGITATMPSPTRYEIAITNPAGERNVEFYGRIELVS